MSLATRFTAIKDPSAKLDYQFDWASWLGADTIVTSTWAAPAGISVESSTKTATTATVWLSGGVDGKDYAAVNTIVTAAGRTDQRTITIQCRKK